MADTEMGPTVSLILIPTWENDLEVYEIRDPIPVGEWVEVVARPGRKLEVLPYDSLIAGGRYDGGHAIVLHTEDNIYISPCRPR